MINILELSNESVFYNCSCGVIGKCVFKSLSKEGPSILNIKCPSCGDKKIIDINSDISIVEDKDTCYSLSIVLFNKILN